MTRCSCQILAHRIEEPLERVTSVRARAFSALAVIGLIVSPIIGTPSVGFADEADAHHNVPTVLVTEKRIEAQNELLSSKTSLPANDLPLSAERVHADTIARIGHTSLGPLLQAATSAAAHPGSGGIFNEILLRGFADAPIYRNGINDSKGQLPIRSLANIESIEVLKGPYGALYGPGEPGGSINFVTKQPEASAKTELMVGFGSYGEFISQLDSTGPLLPSKNVDYRIIARREQSDTFRDFAKRDRLFVNPMLAWRVNTDLRFDAAFEYVSDERLLDTGVAAINGALPLPQERFLGEPGSGPALANGHTFQLSTQYRLASEWNLDLSLNGQKTVFKGNAVEPNELTQENGGLALNRSETLRNEQSKVFIAQAELSGMKVYWSIPHHLLFGFSATGVNEDNLLLASEPDVDPFAIDPFAPIYGRAPPTPELERDSSEQTRQFSVYAQDLLRLGEHWRLMLGLRFDHIDQSGSDGATNSRFDGIFDEVSPRVGIVYKPTRNWSWFASYSGSVDPNEGLRPDGSGLSPTKSEAVEAGVKWQAINYPISIDASVFAIQQTNVTTDAPGNPGFELQTGEQESLGADFELRAEPAPWLSLTTRYTFIDAQILNDAVVRNGTTPLNVAKHQLGALGLVSGSIFKRDDISIGLSLNYLSDRQGSLEPGELSLKLPGYFRGDIFVMWHFSEQLGLELGIENFSDEEYIRGSQSDGLHLIPGDPITIRGQIKLSF